MHLSDYYFFPGLIIIPWLNPPSRLLLIPWLYRVCSVFAYSAVVAYHPERPDVPFEYTCLSGQYLFCVEKVFDTSSWFSYGGSHQFTAIAILCPVLMIVICRYTFQRDTFVMLDCHHSFWLSSMVGMCRHNCRHWA